MRHLLILISLLVLITGCSSVPSAPEIPESTSGTLSALQTGASTSEATQTRVTPALSGSQWGDSSATTTAVEASRTISSNNGAPILSAINLSNSAVDALKDAFTNDTTLRVLNGRLQDLLSPDQDGGTTGTTEDIDALLAQIRDREREIREGYASLGGSFPALTHITSVNINYGAAGTDVPPITQADAAAAAIIPNIINQARPGDPDTTDTVIDAAREATRDGR